MRSSLNAIGNVRRHDLPVSVNQDVRGDGDVAAFRAHAFVDQPVFLNDLAIGITKDAKRQLVPLNDLPGLLRGIDGDRQQMSALSLEFRIDLSETSELRLAGRSPVAAIEDQQDRAVGQRVTERYRRARVIREGEVRSRR